MVQTAPAQPVLNPNPARLVGQPSIASISKSQSPNWVEGKEFWRPNGVALDTTASPPHLYVADTLNNRILGWRNAAGFQNGAAADLVLAQLDFQSTLAQGPNPGSPITRGVWQPTGMAVDKDGNLWVADSGNNRILRFAKPFDAGASQFADAVIGQADFSSGRANRGGAVAANTVSTPTFVGSPDNHLTLQSLAFDSNGNLWFTDTGNHRVLRYPAGQLTNNPNADVVLGQISMTANTGLSYTSSAAENLAGLRYPTGVALDPSGRIYVCDGLDRILVYGPTPAALGTSALRLLGRIRVAAGQQPPPSPNAIGFGFAISVTMMGNRPVVLDPGYNRILLFDQYESWPADSPSSSTPQATGVIGQGDPGSFTTQTASASNTGLSQPLGAAFSGSELFVADATGNRVVVFPQGSATATRVLGQPDFGYSAPNLLEGKELYLYTGPYQFSSFGGVNFIDSGGVVVDSTSNPPHMYVADTFNNRILGWRDVRNIDPTRPADLVIGQPNLSSSQINAPANDPNQRNDQGLNLPASLAVDSQGNVYVCDRGNGRVLRFHRPFDGQNFPHADLVLGQANFTSENNDPSPSTMALPYGIAIMPEGHVLVSDMQHNRVLIFKKPAGGDFANGQAAAAVFGQPDFFSVGTAVNQPNRMVSPRGIATDSSGRLFVADMGNNRVVVYSQVASVSPGTDPSPVFLITSNGSGSLRGPIAVAVYPSTGEIWVAESGAGTQQGHVLRYPEFSQLQVSNGQPNFGINSPTAPLSLALDQAANLLVAEAGNRVTFYYKPVWVTNSGNYLPDANRSFTQYHPCCAPGAIATVWAYSPSLSYGPLTEAHFFDLPNPVPLPTVLGDIQVLFNGIYAPIYDVVPPNQINIQVPKGAQTSGAIDVVVLRNSTREVLGFGGALMKVASPGLLTNTIQTPVAGMVQVSAQQFADNPVSCNGPAGTTTTDTYHCPGGIRPVSRGEVITLYATGQGLLANMPADGAASPQGESPTDIKPFVLIGTTRLADSDILYSGLAPGLIGVWQINVRVPDAVPPGAAAVYVAYQDVGSWEPNSSLPLGHYPATIIQVKQ